MSQLHIGIVVPEPDPPATGGAERLWRALAERLRGEGHNCELVAIPTPEATLTQVLEGYRRFSQLDVSRFDVVITGKYPAWMIDHPRHLVYLLHPLRGLYDTYPAERGELGDSAADEATLRRLREAGDDPQALIDAGLGLLAEAGSGEIQQPLGRWLVRRLDDLAFSRARAFAAISEEVASRPGYLPLEAPVLVAHPETDLPLVEADLDPTTTFFTASRLDAPKRIDLIIRGFRRLRDSAAQLLIAGDGPDRERLVAEAAGDRRIVFLGRVSDEELARHYAEATAVVFTPQREDFGYITLEAMRAGTPVITTTDSGGPCELVEHNVNGLVVEPEDDELRWAMEHVSSLPHLRWQFSLAAKRRATTVSWTRLIEQIEETSAPTERPKALVVSAYGVEPMVGGGQRRSRYLNQALSRRFDATLLVLSSTTEQIKRRVLEPGFIQVEIPRSEAQLQAETDIYEHIQLPVDDLTIAALAPASPAFGRELRNQLAEADVVISTHPFLVPALPDLDVPLVYDSQNAEAEMKAQLLPDTDGGRWLLAHAVDSETEAVQRTDLITACTPTDLATISQLAPEATPAGLVVENGVDTAALPLRQPGDQESARLEALSLANIDVDDPRPVALFVGSWHPPNVDAARLILELAPLRPDWLFILAGSHSSEFAGGPLPENVHCISIFPEASLWPLLAGADVGLNPMVSGGGSNLKIFDYLAVGVPILSTPIGARGLDNPDRYLELVEPTAEAMAAGLDRLRQPNDDTGARVERGRKLVEESFDWQVLGQRWADRIATLVDRPFPSARSSSTHELLPVLCDEPPPSAVPSVAVMRLVGQRARTLPPPHQENTMDPALRESIKRAADNRRVGQQLPPGARFRLPKEVAIRAGRVLSNEQVNFNQAAIESLENLGSQVFDLRSSHDRLEARLEAAEEANAELQRELRSLQSWRGAQESSRPSHPPPASAAAPAPSSGREATAPPASSPGDTELDRFYQAFEDEFRGSREEVKALLASHLDTLTTLRDEGMAGPVVDVGCGRGEWLEMVGEAGLTGLGFDTNTVAVERANALGLDVRLGDAIAELERLAPASIGAITAFHLVEHLPFPARHALAEAAYRALEPGGLFLVETPNARNLQVAGSSIWLDPTHLHPVHPAQLEFMLVHLGYTDVRIEPLHPAPDEVLIPPLADQADRNSFLSEMAKLVYGSHDVAVSGRKPR